MSVTWHGFWNPSEWEKIPYFRGRSIAFCHTTNSLKSFIFHTPFQFTIFLPAPFTAQPKAGNKDKVKSERVINFSSLLKSFMTFHTSLFCSLSSGPWPLATVIWPLTPGHCAQSLLHQAFLRCQSPASRFQCIRFSFFFSLSSGPWTLATVFSPFYIRSSVPTTTWTIDDWRWKIEEVTDDRREIS